MEPGVNVDLENGTALVGRISSLSALAAFMFRDSTEHLAFPRALVRSTTSWSIVEQTSLAAVLLSVGEFSGPASVRKGRSTCQISARRSPSSPDRLIAFRAVRTIVNQGSDIPVSVSALPSSIPRPASTSDLGTARRSTASCGPRGE